MFTQLAEPIAAYIKATNDHNSDAFLACFTDDALVTDIGRDFHGAVAIKEWSDREVIGANVTFEVTAATVGDGETIVTTKVDGDYDKTNLPDPLLLDHHITVNGDKISRLLILQNQDAE
jgi:hypothetical protein